LTPRHSGLLVDVAVLVVAAVEGVLIVISEPSAGATATLVLAVLALLVRDRWPLPAFVATLPAVVFPGAIVAAIVALYAVSARYRGWWLLTGCGLLTAGSLVFPTSEFAPSMWNSDTLLGLIYLTMTAGAPILLGRFLHSRRELALRLEEVKEAREHERRLDAEAILARKV